MHLHTHTELHTHAHAHTLKGYWEGRICGLQVGTYSVSEQALVWVHVWQVASEVPSVQPPERYCPDPHDVHVGQL